MYSFIIFFYRSISVSLRSVQHCFIYEQEIIKKNMYRQYEDSINTWYFVTVTNLVIHSLNMLCIEHYSLIFPAPFPHFLPCWVRLHPSFYVWRNTMRQLQCLRGSAAVKSICRLGYILQQEFHMVDDIDSRTTSQTILFLRFQMEKPADFLQALTE